LCYFSAILGVLDFLKEVGDSAITCGLLLLGFSQLSTKSVQEDGGITKPLESALTTSFWIVLVVCISE
jgi:hypothetical protein